MSPCLSLRKSLRSQLFSSLLPPRFLLPSLPSTQRSASILSSLSDTRGAYSKKIRRGRGPASGKGKTSGRGHKGQKQHGKVPRNFEGGQTPLKIVHGEHGFKNPKPANLTTVPLTRIQSWITQNRISPAHPITIKELAQSRCANRPKNGIKLLATSMQADGRRSLSTNTGDSTTPDPPLITYPIHITVSRASKAAIAAVEAAGGTVTTRYYTPQAIAKILQGKMHPTESLLGAGPKSGTEIVDQDGVGAVQGETTAAAKSPETPPTPPQQLPKIPPVGTGLSTSFVNNPRISAYRYRLPDPVSRKDLEYYRDPAHRGYLSYQVQEGYTPSLFWKTPESRGRRGQVKGGAKGKRKVTGENKIW